jgi:hypothetical protein
MSESVHMAVGKRTTITLLSEPIPALPWLMDIEEAGVESQLTCPGKDKQQSLLSILSLHQ